MPRRDLVTTLRDTMKYYLEVDGQAAELEKGVAVRRAPAALGGLTRRLPVDYRPVL
jgi:hypothetical protein